MEKTGAMRPYETWQQTQGMILYLLQELLQAKSQEMEAHGTLFSQHQDLAEQLAKVQVVGDSSHEDFWIPQKVKEDGPKVYLK